MGCIFLPGGIAAAGNPFVYVPPWRLVVRLGKLGYVEPPILSIERGRRLYPDMRSYVERCGREFGTEWYHIWAGYSADMATTVSPQRPQMFHAIDLYFQNPRMVHGPVYLWYFAHN